MRCVLFCVLAISVLGHGLPDLLPRHGENHHDAWALFNVTRTCEYDYCRYSFIINEGRGSLETCSFSTVSQGGGSATETEFAEATCLELAQYVLNGRFDDAGILSLTISNPESNRRASFDFEQDHISYPQTVAFQLRPSAPFLQGQLGDLRRRDDKKSLADAPNWTLRNVFRKISSNDRVWMGFHITSEGYDPEWCYMLVHVKGDAKTAPFIDERCMGSNFTVSWGYMRENEGGIMTILNPQRTRQSWFGWNHVNSAEHLNDAGPNPTTDVSA